MASVLTVVRLLNVPLETDLKHTIYFGSRSEQETYFTGKVKHSLSNCTYQRKDNIIRYDANIDDVINCNYVMYKNSAHSSRWYYAFITKMEYVNDGMTFIYIDTDPFQTWLDDYTVHPSFVEREHVNDDTVGLHTYPEGLEVGEYICNLKNNNNGLLNGCIIVGTTLDLNNPEFGLGSWNYEMTSGTIYQGIYSGVRYYEMTKDELENALTIIASEGQSDSIVSIFHAPINLIDSALPPNDGGVDNYIPQYKEVNSGLHAKVNNWKMVDTDVVNTKPNLLNGYAPKNKKLLTYPYTYMLMSNNSGGSAVYKYELFKHPDNDNLCDFNIYSSITPSMSIRLIPLYYNGVAQNNEEGINLGKFPICSWANDVYTNWLTQNGVNIAAGVIGGVAQVVGGVGLMASVGGAIAGAGAIGSGVGSIVGTIGEVVQHSKVPPQAEGNINSGDVTFSSGNLTFTAYQMSVKKEYAQIIDNYFDVEGYKICRVKIPHKNHRRNWWYTKTMNANITGSIPQEDLQRIKNAYNNGVTFWRSGSIKQYNLVNDII